MQLLSDAYRGTGTPAYPPQLMLGIALFMILNGRRSPSQWFRAATDCDQCKFLGRGIKPARKTWYDFRDRSAKFIHHVHSQMIQYAIEQENIDPSDGCLDGTMVAADASRHVVLNLTQVSRRLNRIKRVIASKDDPSQVASRKPLQHTPSWLAKTRSGRQEQYARYRQAKCRILEEMRANRDLPKSLQRDQQRIVISPADVDAVIGKDKLKVTRPLYNVQYMSDFRSDVILSYGVFCKKNDTGMLLPMTQATRSLVGERFKRVHADAGYCSLLELEDAQQADVELFAPVTNKSESENCHTASGLAQLNAKDFQWDASSGILTCPHGYPMQLIGRSKDPRRDDRFVIELRFEQSEPKCSDCPLRDRCLKTGSPRRTFRRLENQHLLDEQKLKMESDVGRSSMRQRKIQVERRFADSKQHRGGSRFHGRGLRRVTAETGLMVVAQNSLAIYKLEKLSRSQAA